MIQFALNSKSGKLLKFRKFGIIAVMVRRIVFHLVLLLPNHLIIGHIIIKDFGLDSVTFMFMFTPSLRRKVPFFLGNTPENITS